MGKVLLSVVIAGVFLSISAQDILFYTDFATTPAGFADAANAAAGNTDGCSDKRK